MIEECVAWIPWPIDLLTSEDIGLAAQLFIHTRTSLDGGSPAQQIVKIGVEDFGQRTIDNNSGDISQLLNDFQDNCTSSYRFVLVYPLVFCNYLQPIISVIWLAFNGTDWMLFQLQLDLQLQDEAGGDISSFITNGEWDLLGKCQDSRL